ncbi:hypothetical protein AB0J57_07535 [Streptomyces sp. NPDC049837]|uniref:hypothetical protein n=1 Tax=Streptomyces sp. NPDC049837 TaxID=3155277 RepID=UPI00341964B0
MDELKRQLREAAGAHHPDRARIHARVERGMAATRATRGGARHRPSARTSSAARPSWARVAGATAAVAAVLAAGGHTAATVLGSDRPDRSVTAQPAAPLRADGTVDPHSNRFWAQSNLTLTAPRPLTTLTVDLRVAQTGGVASTGHWRTLPADDFTVSVREDEAGALHYTWTLKPGRTAPAGRHVFAGQYNHAEGARAADRDRYTVTATDSGGERTSLRGDFAR